MDFINKYLKYKNKYLNMKKQIGGGKCVICGCQYSSPAATASGPGCKCRGLGHTHNDKMVDSAELPGFAEPPGFGKCRTCECQYSSPAAAAGGPGCTYSDHSHTNTQSVLTGLSDTARPPEVPSSREKITLFLQNMGINDGYNRDDGNGDDGNGGDGYRNEEQEIWYILNHTKQLFDSIFGALGRLGINVDLAVFQEIYAHGIFEIPIEDKATIKSFVAMPSNKSTKESKEFYFDTLYKCMAILQNPLSNLEFNPEITLNFFDTAVLDEAAFLRRQGKNKQEVDVVEGYNFKTLDDVKTVVRNPINKQKLMLFNSYMKKSSELEEIHKHMMVSLYNDWLIINIHISIRRELNIERLLENLSLYINQNQLGSYKIIICGDFNHVSKHDRDYEAALLRRNSKFKDFLDHFNMSMHTDLRMGFIISKNVGYRFIKKVEPFAYDNICYYRDGTPYKIKKISGAEVQVPYTTEHFGYICDFFEMPDGNGYHNTHNPINFNGVELPIMQFWRGMPGHKYSCLRYCYRGRCEMPALDSEQILVDRFDQMLLPWWDKSPIETLSDMKRFINEANTVYLDQPNQQELVKQDFIRKFQITESQYKQLLLHLSTMGWWINSEGYVSSQRKEGYNTKLSNTDVDKYYVNQPGLLSVNKQHIHVPRLVERKEWYVDKGMLKFSNPDNFRMGMEILYTNDLDRMSQDKTSAGSKASLEPGAAFSRGPFSGRGAPFPQGPFSGRGASFSGRGASFPEPGAASPRGPFLGRGAPFPEPGAPFPEPGAAFSQGPFLGRGAARSSERDITVGFSCRNRTQNCGVREPHEPSQCRTSWRHQ